MSTSIRSAPSPLASEAEPAISFVAKSTSLDVPNRKYGLSQKLPPCTNGLNVGSNGMLTTVPSTARKGTHTPVCSS